MRFPIDEKGKPLKRLEKVLECAFTQLKLGANARVPVVNAVDISINLIFGNRVQ